MNIVKSFLVSAVFVLLSKFGISQGESVNLIVYPHTVECWGNNSPNCFHVSYESSPEQIFVVDHINGFIFEPGYKYLLIVLAQPSLVPNPNNDYNVAFNLLSVISKEAIEE